LVRQKKSRKKEARICFRVSKEHKEILQMIAEYGGMDLSELFRSLALSLILRFKSGLPIVLPEVQVDENSLHISKEAEG